MDARAVTNILNSRSWASKAYGPMLDVKSTIPLHRKRVDVRCELCQQSGDKHCEDIREKVLRQSIDFPCYMDYCLLGCGAVKSAT
jgi:hypothetical protein